MANLNYYMRKIKQYTLTEWLIGLNIVGFILTQLVNLTLGNGLLRLGAKVNVLIAFGEYWRLITAMFLHADLLHLIFNMIILYILGRDIERFFGKTKFLAIYFLAGITGSAASYIFTPNVSVGASGAIFGLMGANLFLYKINPTVYKRIYGTDFLALIGFNLVLGFVRPNIDMAGHVGGLIAGFILAFALGLSYEKPFVKKRIPFQALALILILLPVSFGTFRIKSSPESYATAFFYYYSSGRTAKAEKILERADQKFPNEGFNTLR